MRQVLQPPAKFRYMEPTEMKHPKSTTKLHNGGIVVINTIDNVLCLLQ